MLQPRVSPLSACDIPQRCGAKGLLIGDNNKFRISRLRRLAIKALHLFLKKGSEKPHDLNRKASMANRCSEND